MLLAFIQSLLLEAAHTFALVQGFGSQYDRKSSCLNAVVRSSPGCYLRPKN